MILRRSTSPAPGLALATLAALVLSMSILSIFTAPTVGAQDAAPDDGSSTTSMLMSPSGEETPQRSESDESTDDSGGSSESPESTEPAEKQTRIIATLMLGSKPLKGIDMVVSKDGDQVGRGTSDSKGVVAVAVPESGQYNVTLDDRTFPDGVRIQQGAPTELKPQVLGQNDRPVIFRLVGADHAAESGPTSFDRLASLFASGLRFGLVIALAAVGLSLIFGTTGLTNFAHGELLTFGAMATWYLNSKSGGLGIPLVLAAIGGIILAGVFGASFELAVYRPLRRKGMPIISQMVVSIGLALASRYFFSVVFGSNSKQYSQYAAQAPTVDLGPVSLRPKDLIISAVALVALIAVGLFLQRSRLGTAIRAVSDNPSLAIASGINDNRVVLIVWILAGGLGGLAGTMLGSTEAVQWNMGQHVLLIMFAAVLLGGLGTTFGAMLGGIFVGVVSDLSTFWLDADLKIVVALATLVAVLLVKPSGVFGVTVRKA